MRFPHPCFGGRLLRIVYVLFLLGFAGRATAEGPQVFWASDPVKPGQTVQLSGMRLAEVDAIEIMRLGDRPDTAAPDTAQAAELLAKSDNSLSFVLPKTLDDGVFSVRLRSSNEEATFQLNAPDLYWMQGDRGTASTHGGWMRVSGRNMAVTDQALVALTSRDGREIRLKVDRQDIWSASFPVPDHVPTGSYGVKLWNGAGDRSAWRDVGKIEIEAPPQMDRPVMELFSNQPDRADHDDTARLNAAMDALGRRGGGTLKLHFGVYRLTAALKVPDGVSLAGEANGLVTLIWKDMETPPDALITGVSDFSLENLTINAKRHFNIIKGGFDASSGAVTGRNITLKNVTIRASSFFGHVTDEDGLKRIQDMRVNRKSGVVALLLGGSNIVIEDCDVFSSMRPFLFMKATDSRVIGNTFRVGRGGWYAISGPDGVLFENNRIIGNDFQASGGGINTLEGYSSARNVLIRNNRFEVMFGGDREAFTSDGPNGYYRGPLLSLSGPSVRIDPVGLAALKDRSWQGAGLFVVKGPGLGLVARIVKRDGDMLELDRDLSDLVDMGSIASVVPMQENYLIIGNQFEDVGQVQIFGTGYKHVFAENKALRSTGFGATSLFYRHLQPNFYIQFLGNELIGAAFNHASLIDITGRQFKDNDTLLAFGMVIRGNRLDAASTIRVDGRSTAVPAVRNVLIEDNTISRTDIGIDIGPGVEELTMRDNKNTEVRIPIRRNTP